jgi:sugar lactone lactonase YvrE
MRPSEDGEGNPDDRTQTEGFNVDEEGRLYIAGGGSGQLHVYDLPSGRKIAQFAPNGFINDVDIGPNGDVYFTDSVNPFIYRVTAEQVEAGTAPLRPSTWRTTSTTLRALGPTTPWKPTASTPRPTASASSLAA